MNPQTSKPVSSELEASINLATRALNEYTNQAGLCALYGCAWPCEHAVLAPSMTDPGPGPVSGVRTVSLGSDLDSGRPLVEQLPSKAPGGRPAPCAADCSVDLAMEVAALAALLAEVVQFAGRAAIFPGHWEALAEKAMEHDACARPCWQHRRARREHVAQPGDWHPHRRPPE